MNSDALRDLCLRYLDGDLTESELEHFDQLIVESKEAARVLACLAINDSRFEVATAFVLDSEWQENQIQDLIDAMLEVEQYAPLRVVSLDDQVEVLPVNSKPKRVSKKDVTDLLGIVFWEAARGKPAKWIAAAAVVLFGVGLLYLLSGNNDRPDTSPPAATSPGDQTRAITEVVAATLTAEQEAVWAEGSLAVGSELHVGRHLSLISGVAQITTRRGAVAILEAPATIEVIDSPNALRLHSGKLVGICETESSKGFLVRAPRVDITDLGTRFGVNATSSDSVQVHVFDGEVELNSSSHQRPELNGTRLLAGQGSSIDSLGIITEIQADTLAGFVSPKSLTFMGILTPREKWARSREQLIRDPDLLAVVPFISPGSDWQDGFGYVKLHGGGEELEPDRNAQSYAPAVVWRGDHGLGNSIVLSNSRTVFIDLDMTEGGRIDRAALITGDGLIGRPGTELYITWRMQGGDGNLALGAFVGLSLMRGYRSQTDEPLFIGCTQDSINWSVQARHGKGQSSEGNFVRPLIESGASIQADTDAHLWLVCIEFAEGPDRVRFFLDPDLSTPELPEANLEIDTHDVSFDRLRFTTGDTELAWRFSDLMVSTTRPFLSPGTLPGDSIPDASH